MSAATDDARFGAGVELPKPATIWDVGRTSTSANRSASVLAETRGSATRVGDDRATRA